MGLRNWIRSWVDSSGSPRLRDWVRSWSDRQPATPAPGTPPATADDDEDLFRDLPAGGPVDQADTPYGPGDGPTPPTGSWFSPNEQVALNGAWVKLNSSNVDEIRYVAQDKALEVRFLDKGKGSAHYRYLDVPASVFLRFLETDSPGRFVWNVLRADGYRYQRLDASATTEEPEGGEIIPGEGGPRKQRRLLPEEVAAHRDTLDRLRPGESARVPRVRLKGNRYR